MNGFSTNKIKILSYLNRIIDGEFVLIGVPKHMNLGDTMIWETELELFNDIDKKPKHTYFFYENPEIMNISADDIIVWNGGGYFGDVWNFMEYSKKIFSYFANNKIVFMPNSLWFNSQKSKQIIVSMFKNHGNTIFLMVRDKQSFEIASRMFSDINNIEITMHPDVVLLWDVEQYMKTHGIENENGNGTLYIARNDKEKKTGNIDFLYDIKTDWPTIEKKPKYITDRLTCSEWEATIKDRLIGEAIRFIMPYENIISERMHGGILSWLLGKNTIMLDNSYGKISSLYDTWLKDEKNIKCY